MSNLCKQSTGLLAGFETVGPPVEHRTGGIYVRIMRALAAPGIIWWRIIPLFVVLCGIKVWLMYTFGRNLYQIHWRIAPEPVGIAGEISLYLFALLCALNIWVFGTRCRACGTKPVRAANAALVVLAAAFVLLTLNAGENNYLYPVLKGTLRWRDLAWYLSMDSFFRPPYLSLWLLVYGSIYYCLVRTGREKFILYATALFAGAYVATCLRRMAFYRDALIVADCLGIVCLVAARRGRSTLKIYWSLMPLLWAGLFWWLFSRFDAQLRLTALKPEFVIMLCVTIVLLGGGTFWAKRSGFFTAWSWLLPFASVSFLLLLNTQYDFALNYQNLLCLGLTSPRYFAGEIGLALVLLALAVGYVRLKPAGSLWWLDVLNLLIVAWTLADLRLAQIMGVRLDWHALSLAYGETPRMMWRMAQPYLPALVALLAVGSLVFAGIFRVRSLAPRLRFMATQSGLSQGLPFGLLLFVLLGILGMWLAQRDKAEGQSFFLLVETSPIWGQASSPAMDEREFKETVRRLGMDQMLSHQTVRPHPAHDWNVVLVFQESSYNKYLSLFDGQEETQPSLSKYRNRMELFPNFFSNFADSINSRFAAFTGLYPVQDYKAFTLRHVPVKSIFEVLKDNGYTCSLFYSSFFDYTGFGDFLRGRGIDEMFDADNMPGPRVSQPVSWGLREGETLRAIRNQIKDYAAERKKFFLTYVPAAPHMPYDGTPKKFRRYQTGRMGDYTPAYLDELLYMDSVISSIIDQLKESGVLDRTLVVITDDHGELLGENGGPVGHGWILTPELANVPLIIMDPTKQGCRTNYTIGSQVDLLPTMLDLLGIPIPADQCYQGLSLCSAAASTNRTIYLDSFRDYGIISGSRLVFGDRDNDANSTSSPTGSEFTLANQGVRTLFGDARQTTSSQNSISAFEKFQGNFLLHYSQYCRMRRYSKVAGK